MSSPFPILQVPITFDSCASEGCRSGNLLDISFSRAQPSVLKSWPASEGNTSVETRAGGMAIGAVDGTLYLFRRSRYTTTPPQPPVSGPQLSGPTSWPTTPFLRDSRPTSRASTSSTSPARFNVNSRSRAVSGVTVERVEAPKNYVDFDDEPERLRDILKGRNPKEHREKLNGSEIGSKPPSPSLSAVATTSVRRKNTVKPITVPQDLPPAADGSSACSLRGYTPFSSAELNLWCHILPPHFGPGTAVTNICLLDDNHLAVLQEMGDLSIFSLRDGNCLASINVGHKHVKPPDGIRGRDLSHYMLSWNHLQVYHVGESIILFASAAVDTNVQFPLAADVDDSGALEKSLITVLEYTTDEFALEKKLVVIGQWCFEGPACGFCMHQEPKSMPSLLFIGRNGNLSSRIFELLPRVPIQPGPSIPDAHLAHLPSLPLANPFKAMKLRSADHVSNEKDLPAGRVSLQEQRDLGEVLADDTISGLHSLQVGSKLMGIAWSSQRLTAFQYESGSFSKLCVDPITGVKDVAWIDDSSYRILFDDRIEEHALEADSDVRTDPTDSRIVRSRKLRDISIGTYDVGNISCSPEVLTVSAAEADGCQLHSYTTTSEDGAWRLLWHANSSQQDFVSERRFTSLLPLELDLIIEGHADGCLQQSSLIAMCAQIEKSPVQSKQSEAPLDGSIVGLHTAHNPRTKEKFIVGGADDGSIAFWTMDHLKLCVRWTVFVAPLANVLQISEKHSGPLKGCVLCISVDGTVAVIAVDGFQFLYLVPGAPSALCRVCVGERDLLLVYANHRARLWDLHTKELWRSMSSDKVNELLEHGEWIDLSPTVDACKPNIAINAISGISACLDVASTLNLDLPRFVTESVAIAKTISTNRDQTRAILLTLERLRAVLSTLLTPGLNTDIDNICSSQLRVEMSPKSIGFSSGYSVVLYNGSQSRDGWCISNEVSAARVLSITVILKAMSLYEEYMDAANTVMLFYANSLASFVGSDYQPPSLVFLALRWFDGSNEVHQAARILFDHIAAGLTDEQAGTIAEQWQHQLPCLQPTADRESMHAALALFLCGYLAAEKYTLFSTSTLTDISKSIVLYLHDEQSLHRVLAIDLCSKGFHVWQHYVDAMDLIRALISLATTPRKEAISIQNVGVQARLAILRIASDNAPLFMATLGLDILSPSSLEYRRSILQIIAFFIRKRPLVLQPNISKLMDAVVKSLDPNATTHREAVLETATEIIGYVVRTFPNVDFHMSTQRLAVGTSDGAIIMYDLKTATRLYVLESHKKVVSACSFSPDGRRLLSLSLDENVVLVWKVGSSFTSFFHPGAPPRQGRGGTQPFKTINFNIGDAAEMTVAETLEFIKFEWLADRSVKVKIRESILTFSA